MPPSRNNTVKFTDLQPISSVNPGDIIPVVDTSVPTLVNKKINVQDFSRSLPVNQQVTQMGAVSGNWDSTYTTTQSNSATWGTGGTYGTVYSQNSAKYESAYSNVLGNSANWDSAYATVQSSSAAWTGLTTYTTVQQNSAGWESVESTVLANSASWIGGNIAYTSLNSLSSDYWLLKSGDQVTGALTTTKALTTQFTNSEEFVSKRYADAIAFQTQVSGNFVPGLYYTRTESDDRFFNQGENTLLAQNLSAFTGNTINIHSNTLILSSQNNASNSPLLRMSRFGAGLYFDAARCLIRGDHWGDGDAGFIQLLNHVNIGRDINNPGLHVNVTNPKVFILGNGTESGIGFSPTTNYTISDTYLMREVPYTLALRTGTNQHALRIYRTFTDTSNFERLSLSATRIQTEFAGTGRAYDLSITAAGSGSLVLSGANLRIGSDGSIISTTDSHNQPLIYQLRGGVSHGFGAGSAGGMLVWGGSSLANVGSSIMNITDTSIFFQKNISLVWGRGGYGWGAEDTAIVRPSPGTLDQRQDVTQQAYRIYNTYTDANNWERLGLSATRIAYERAGTGVARDLTITTPGNLILSGAGIFFNTASPFSLGTTSLTADRVRFQSRSALFTDPYITAQGTGSYNWWIADNTVGGIGIFTGSGPSLNFAVQYGYWGAGLLTRATTPAGTFGNSIFFLIARDGAFGWCPDALPAQGTNTENADTFIYRDAPYTIALRDRQNQTYTNALRIYNRYTDSSNYERLSLSATRIDYEFAGTGIKRDLEVGTGIIPTVSNAGDLGSSTKRWGHLYTIYDVIPGRDIAFDSNTSRIVFRYYDSGGSSVLLSDASHELAQRNGTAPQRYRIYNTYTDANNYERLSLSATRIAYEFAGTGASRDLTIQSTGNIVLSAGGRVNISQSLPVYFNSLSAGKYTVDSTSDGNTTLDQHIPVIEVKLTDTVYPFTNSTRFAVSQSGRIMFSGNPFGVYDTFFLTGSDYGITMGSSGGGNITYAYIRGDTTGSAFTRVFARSSGSIGFLNTESLNTSNEVNKDVTLYRDAADRLALRRTTNSQEFRVYNTFTNLFNFERLNVSPTTIRQEISGTGTRQDLTIYSTRNLILSAGTGSTLTQVTSTGNFLTTGLVCLGGTTPSNAAIKGSGTTVVAKLGDDSDYAFLQGKLQTLNTAAAGTFTPDKYLILYDSTGTAYKVPVQAL